MNQIENVIPVESLDNAETSKVVTAIEKLEATGSPNQELKLKIRSSKGNIENGLDIASSSHIAKNVDLTIEVGGANGPASAIICAAGKPGTRVASMGTTFKLTEGQAYEADTKAANLEEDDKVVYQTLSALTGKRKYILEAILKASTLDVKAAKKCGIIDSVTAFKSKYRIPKPKKNTTTAPQTQATGNEQAISPEVISAADSTTASAEVPRRRGRKKTIVA